MGVPLTRSIQIGLRGNTEALLDPNVVVKITDVTSDFRNALEALKQGNSDQAETLLWPDGRIERLMEVPNPIRENLGMAHNIAEKIECDCCSSHGVQIGSADMYQNV